MGASNLRLTPQQCKRARAILKWNPQDLAGHTRLSVRTIEQFERNQIKLQKPDNSELIEAFGKQGVTFTNDGNVHTKTPTSSGHSSESGAQYIETQSAAPKTSAITTMAEAKSTANAAPLGPQQVHIGTSPQTESDH